MTIPAVNTAEVFPCKESLRQKFEAAEEVKNLIAKDIERCIEQVLAALDSRPTIKVRTKKFKSYYRKYLNLLKAGDPDPYITDIIGIRVICPFIEELSIAENLLKKNFSVTETERKGQYTFREFGYESTHLLIKIPDDIIQARGDIGLNTAEVQIRTTLQDAWAEVEHELVYKAEFNPFDTPMRRKLAALNASLSLADIIFQEIRTYQRQFHSQLGRRRETFFQKIEESTDNLLFADAPVRKESLPETASRRPGKSSIDDLLLDALTFHNENRFEDAITLYSRILKLNPEKNICSLIRKHRGMANFAQSKYRDAIDDFTASLELDKSSYKAAYYRGVVYSVLKQYPQAIDDFTLSLEINPYQDFCLFRRAQAYYHLGDYPHALSDCEASLSIEPGNDAAVKFRDMLQIKYKM